MTMHRHLHPLRRREPHHLALPRSRAARVSATLAAGLLALSAAGCGGAGLKHTVAEEDLKTLSAEARAPLSPARAKVKAAAAALTSTRVERDGAKSRLAQTQAKEAAVDREIAAAKRGLESADETLDKSLAAAKARRDESIAAANKVYEEEAAQAKERHGSAKSAGTTKLSAAERAAAVTAARQVYETAALEREQSLVALRDAELWHERAKLERAKLEVWLKGRTVDPKEAAEKRAAFDLQVAERQQAVLNARAAHAQKERAAKSAKARLDALLNAG